MSLVHVEAYEDPEEPNQRNRRGRPIGRPPKLTKELTVRICAAIREGNFQATAARLCGVPQSTYSSWKARGDEARAEVDAGRPITPREKPFLEFLEAIEEARAIAEARKVEALSRIAEGREVKREVLLEEDGDRKLLAVEYHRPDPRALEFFLKASFRDTWGKPEKVEHSGPGGGAIPVEVEVSARETLREKLKLVSERATSRKEEAS